MSNSSKKPIFKEFTFPCKQCGASLVFSPNVNALKCEYCGTINEIKTKDEPIIENDFQKALKSIQNHKSKKALKNFEAKCPNCGGKFKLLSYQRTTLCPYCSTPILTNIDIFYDFHPQALIPFRISKKEASVNFKRWIGSLWFAPNDLQKSIEVKNIEGIYIPYWTYDANTTTHYQGQRGDVYYDYSEEEFFEDGRVVKRVVRRENTIWTPVSGVVSRWFDDVLIGASYSIPRIIIDKLSPWNLKSLISYDEKYLSGYESEVYQVGLDYGLIEAKKVMEITIRDDVRREIGGDKQVIEYMKTYYDDITFKYILLPIYKSEFKYNNKLYTFAINAQTGRVYGKRPYSYIKIFFLILFILSIIIGAIYLDNHPEILDKWQF